MKKLLHGLHQFQSEIHSINQEFFEHLSKGQKPDAIFITCSDSRVVPNLITTTDPGELFVIRNAGNIVPPYGVWSGEEASIEYAVNALEVKDIVVCGHSQCGAIKGLLKPESLEELPAVAHWLRHAEDTRRILDENYHEQDFETVLNIAIQENVLVQIEHLRSLPCIAKRIMKREIELHAWTYQIETGKVYIYDPIAEDFCPLVKTENGFELGIE
ncbi:MAG: carbonic anhydrase [Candidatus Melainabacteria bacterium]|nr:carbonic anhydrase [Candidatus Melainabacteria bacterium]